MGEFVPCTEIEARVTGIFLPSARKLARGTKIGARVFAVDFASARIKLRITREFVPCTRIKARRLGEFASRAKIKVSITTIGARGTTIGARVVAVGAS